MRYSESHKFSNHITVMPIATIVIDLFEILEQNLVVKN